MKHPIKLHIKLRKPLGPTWVKFHLKEKLILEADGPIQTEAQLMGYIYQKHGPGRYQLLAWQKGHKGFWMFWLGDCLSNGFVRDKNKNKSLERLQKDHAKADSFEDKQDIEEEMDFEKEMYTEDQKYKRQGPRMIKTSKVGQLNSYEAWR